MTWSSVSITTWLWAISTSSPRTMAPMVTPSGSFISSRRRPTTFEDPSVTAPEDRERIFGQHDHLRIYGDNFPELLSEAGFDVIVINEKSFLEDVVQRHVLFPPVLSARPLATNHRKVFFGRKRRTVGGPST